MARPDGAKLPPPLPTVTVVCSRALLLVSSASDSRVRCTDAENVLDPPCRARSAIVICSALPVAIVPSSHDTIVAAVVQFFCVGVVVLLFFFSVWLVCLFLFGVLS